MKDYLPLGGSRMMRPRARGVCGTLIFPVKRLVLDLFFFFKGLHSLSLGYGGAKTD